MKKWIFISLGVLSIITISAIVYLNSYDYKYKMAEKERNRRVKSFDTHERVFLNEGLYSFEHYYADSQVHNDVNGNLYRTDEVKYFGHGEFSLTSKKFIITCKGIKDELIVQSKEISIYGFDSYKFEIIDWKAFNLRDNTCIYDSKKDDKFNSRFVDNRPSLFLNVNYHSSRLNKEVPLISLNLAGFEIILSKKQSTRGFKCLHDASFIFENLEHNYIQVGMPSYVSDAKYPDEVYDIQTYMKK